MLQAIITNTPIWVWFILLFIISRGVKATQDRVMSFKAVVLLPILMMLWSLQGIFQHFGLQLEVIASWSIGCILGLALVLKIGNKHALNVMPDGQIHLKGSWKPLFLLLSIFLMKYAENVLVVMSPVLKTEMYFIIGTSLVYGVMNGLFLVNLVRIIYLTGRNNSASVAQTV